MDSEYNFNLVETLNQCKSFCYSGKKVITHTQIFVGFLIACVIEAVLIGVIRLVFNAEIMMSVLAGSLTFIAILVIGIPIKIFQIDAMKALTQYFVDENGDFYKVQFLAACSDSSRSSQINLMRNDLQKAFAAYDAMKQKESDLGYSYEDAQSKVSAYNYVMRYKAGYKDWNAFDGGEAKVRYLGKLIEKNGNKYTFMVGNKKKVRRISKEFDITL